MGRNSYTKAQSEQIVYAQLENLDAMNDLLRNMKLKDELSKFKQTFVKYPTSLGKKKEYPFRSPL